jgi:hypothetical protein
MKRVGEGAADVRALAMSEGMNRTGVAIGLSTESRSRTDGNAGKRIDD